MVKRTYTKEQRAFLLQNKNVAKCGDGVITYAEVFKIKAVKQYHEEGWMPQEIFIDAGFDIETIGRKKPQNCLERWNKAYKERGIDGLLELSKRKIKPQKIKSRSDKDKINRLKLEIEYLKAKNDFLAKLRAKRK